MPTPPDSAGLRKGYTTGGCAAAAALAATRCLVRGVRLESIETTLPNRTQVTFALERCELKDDRAVCSVIKDAGDDPDCTHGAELVAEVRLRDDEGVLILAGDGVATVTKPGLGLEVGTTSITAVPRRNLTDLVLGELDGSDRGGAVVTLSVPGGEEMAKQTLNSRLGLVGGISILGTTGVVTPYSTAAYRASVLQAVDVAATMGREVVVLTTGGRSETYAMTLHPEITEDAFIQVGDFIGVGVRRAANRGISRGLVVGMIGKLSKMAAGKTMTHAKGSKVDTHLLARFAAESGAVDSVVAEVEAANTARHVMEITQQAGVPLADVVCREASKVLVAHAGGSLPVEVEMVDFDGNRLGEFRPASDDPEESKGGAHS